MSQYDDSKADHQRQGPDERVFPSAAPASSDGAAENVALTAGDGIVYAGLWRRMAAYFADAFVIYVMSAGIAAVSGISRSVQYVGLDVLLPLLVAAAYLTFSHASRYQATLGKLAVGIKVVRQNGERLSHARAFGRFCGEVLSSVTFTIGYLMAAFTPRKQALHDLLCGSLVVDKWAFTDTPHLQKKGIGIVACVILVVSSSLIAGYILVVFMLLMFLGNLFDNSLGEFFGWLSRPRNY